MTPARFLVFLLAVFAANPAAFASEGNTLHDELRIVTDDVALQCTSVKDQLETFNVMADPLTGYNLKDAVQSLCVCIPEKIRALRGTLSAEQLAKAIGEQEYLDIFNPAVIDKCAAEQMRAMYGADCPRRFNKAGIDVGEYCTCMNAVMGRYSEAGTAALAAAASNYLPAAAEAERRGEPAPPRPPALEAYWQADQGCKAGKR